MKLYVNGCSFTQGNTPGVVSDHTWASNELFTEKFDEILNEAQNGGSSHRALRMAMTHMVEHSTEDWEYIIQLSEFSRTEFYIPDVKGYGGIHPLKEEALHDRIHPIVGLHSYESEFRRARETMLLDTDEDVRWYDIALKLTALDKLALEENKTVTIIAAGGRINPKYYDDDKTALARLTNKLLGNIKKLSFKTKTFTDILDGDGAFKDHTGHPSTLGHKKIAEYLIAK